MIQDSTPTPIRFRQSALTQPSAHDIPLSRRQFLTANRLPFCLLHTPFLLPCDMDEQSRSARFHVLFEPALQAYERKTGIILAEHPLAAQLQSCHSIESTTTLLLGEVRAFCEFGGRDRIIKSIKNIASILSTLFSTAAFGEAIDLVRQKALMACSMALTVFFTVAPTCESNICWPCYPTCCTCIFLGYTRVSL